MMVLVTLQVLAVQHGSIATARSLAAQEASGHEPRGRDSVPAATARCSTSRRGSRQRVGWIWAVGAASGALHQESYDAKSPCFG